MNDDVIITWTAENWLTVTLMAVLGFIAFRVVVLMYSRVTGNGG